MCRLGSGILKSINFARIAPIPTSPGRQCQQHQFDIAGAFLEVLGKPVEQISQTYARGELLIDTATDLVTNASKGLSKDNSLLLRRGSIRGDAIVKLAQTFRSGTNDIDAIDFIEMFLENPTQTSFDTLADVYVLSRFRPVLTDKNWRMDCGVDGGVSATGPHCDSVRTFG